MSIFSLLPATFGALAIIFAVFYFAGLGWKHGRGIAPHSVAVRHASEDADDATGATK